ncbi:transpeptidase [Geotalea uraniireducens]|uniref:Transpeptidase n=1 Tax=Geotalea uraniireducens TaxID=351604 RepID=A0ABN6VPE2_9BACT|nr:L,D-transpeptidase family protein [Geotalea uraniireducens]BDV42151.1 transpeptidase [Geotalea uraniireducens]
MSRIADLSISAASFRLLACGLCLLALQGCAALKFREEPAVPQGRLADSVEAHDFTVASGDDVIGRLAVVTLEKGDTLPDIARHFGLGINAISAANPKVDVWVPAGGERVILPLSFILPDAPRKGIVVNVATMRLFQYKANGATVAVATYPVGVGTRERPTPTGPTRVYRKTARPTWHVPASIAADHLKKGDPLPAEVPPGPENPLGEYALYLSRSGYLIHGTNKPASIGLKATNGCMRLYPENIRELFNDTPVNTPVAIVNQPYLVGQRDGVLYLEAHTPLEDSGAAELARIDDKLRAIEKKAGRPLDWQKIKEVQSAARGVPIPIFALRPGVGELIPKGIVVAHPAKLFGQPQVPALKLDAWYVLAADLSNELDARRLAAIINHQGPPIPARVLAKSDDYRVLAGPFADGEAAREAVKRLKIDLELDGIVIDPAGK